MRNRNYKLNLKKTLIGMLLLFAFVLVGCKEKKTEFQKIFESLNLPTETIADLNLPVEVDGVSINWSSDNYRVINGDGRFIRPDEDVKVTLSAAMNKGTHFEFFEHEVKALGWEEQKINLNSLKDPQGFASINVTNRKNLKDKVLVANNELEFIEHLYDTQDQKDVVIKITKDLNMGAKNIAKLAKAKDPSWDGKDPKKTKYLDGKVFRENTNIPTLHPILLEEGVGQLIIQSRDGLMIYSEEGITIKHMTTHIKGNISKGKSKNIVFRNLHLTGIWEWDEVDRGDYKSLDWDYFTIEDAEDIWLDHLTLGTAYDGLADVKGNTKNITLSWLNLDFGVDDFIKAQFDFLEENRKDYPFYDTLRKDISKETISIVAAGQKKGFNFGNTEGGPNFEEITITMHNIYAKNLQDRFPRLRRGDVHIYNVILDSEELQELKDARMKVISQGLVPTEQGAILMENSSFVGVNEPIKTHQASNLDEDFTGRFKVVNSEYTNQAHYYLGSSGEPGLANPWVRSNNNISSDLDFYFRNYQTLPYEYDSTDANKLSRKFKDNPMGASKIEGFDWLDIKKMDNTTIDRGKKINDKKIEGLNEFNGQVGKPIPIFDITLYNFYTGLKFRDTDFSYYSNASEIDVNVPGKYDITYTFYLFDFPDELVEYTQRINIYDPNDDNVVYDSEIGRPFDNLLSGILKVYESKGTLYYYLSNDPLINNGIVVEQGESIDIKGTTVEFNYVDVTGSKYMHFVVVEDEFTTDLEVYTHEIESEIIVEITNYLGIASMLTAVNSNGRYYKLMNDIDFSELERDILPKLSADNIFRGVFDGSGYTISNLYRHGYGGGLFHTIADGKVKNITFDNVEIDIHSTRIIDDEGVDVGEQKTSARAGIVAGQIKGGLGILDNITIKNSKVISNNNYASILVGKVEGYSSALITNIYVENSQVKQTGEYAGGLIAGIENNTTTSITDIYIDGLEVIERFGEETGHKMIGIVAGRVGTGTHMERIFITNANADTKASIGGLIGKDDRKGQAVDTILKDIYVDLAIKTHSKADGNYFGNLIGNPDKGSGHAPVLLDNVWGSAVETLSSGQSADEEYTIELNELNLAWYKANFQNFLDSGLWEVVGNKIVLKGR